MDKSARKVRNEDINPCIEESDASQKCSGAYSYDTSMCSAYFQRYKNCRKYWHTIMLQRRRDGVRPDMPTAAERKEMLAAIGGKPYWESAWLHRDTEDQRAGNIYYKRTYCTMHWLGVYCDPVPDPSPSSGCVEVTICICSILKWERGKSLDWPFIEFYYMTIWLELTQHEMSYRAFCQKENVLFMYIMASQI